MLFSRKKSRMITGQEALPGRDHTPFPVPDEHEVLGTPIKPPFPEGIETVHLALGCFWGAERLFWQIPGVYTTAVGYAGGFTPNPTYDEVCSGRTGHAEAVLVAYDPKEVSFKDLLQVFFEEHNPTQGMRQGNDVGTQYRSAIYYTTDEQREVAEMTLEMYDQRLKGAGFDPITTEIAEAGPFYYAEDEHQQYLHKVPYGYCGLKGTGVSCSVPELAGGSVEADEGLKPLAENEEEWRMRLSPEQYEVLRQAGTERAFTGGYTDLEDDGIYRCGACGNVLFQSDTKYHSGCGWPSFTEAVSPDAVELSMDTSHGMVRTEVRCSRCNSHLGHVFDDGPADRGGKRYCMNSIAMEFEEK
jgi:peptide-methionine (S)-S-oxide reductase